MHDLIVSILDIRAPQCDEPTFLHWLESAQARHPLLRPQWERRLAEVRGRARKALRMAQRPTLDTLGRLSATTARAQLVTLHAELLAELGLGLGLEETDSPKPTARKGSTGSRRRRAPAAAAMRSNSQSVLALATLGSSQ